MKINLLVSLALISFYTNANMAPAGFERFMNSYFVETGTYAGDGIKLALRAGFKNIHSIEINPVFVNEAKRNFSKCPHVHIWQGDSGKILFDVIKDINEPITFWLDGHNGFPSGTEEKNTPLLEELEQIKKHHIKNHTIVIDDMHCCGTLLFDFIEKEEIIQKIKAINQNYFISYVDGGGNGEVPNNIMVAQIVT